jgi:glycine/D-amino acid oxidase-like deaminating enzyme
MLGTGGVMGDSVTEVVIVGGGISGCVTAYELARRGVRVTLVEKDDVAYEQSGRNAGAIGILGKHAADLAAASVSRWDELATELPCDFEFSKTGRLCPAHTPEDFPALDDMVETAAQQNIPIEMLSGEDVRRRFPWIGVEVLRAAFSPQDASVDPVPVTRGFAKLAIDRGVKIERNCAVKTLDRQAGRIRGVVTERGYLRADAVLVAAGVWSGRLLDPVGVHVPMQYVALYNALTDPQPPVVDCFLRGPKYGARQLRSGAVRIFGGYRNLGAGHNLSLRDFKDLRTWLPYFLERRSEVRLRVDPRLLWFELRSLFSGSMAPKQYSPRAPRHFLPRRLDEVKRVVPMLRNARLAEIRTGVVDITIDALPVLGGIDTVPGLYVAMGFNGQGFSLGPVVGRLMAEVMTQGSTSISLKPYRWSRFAEGHLKVPKRLV